MSKLSLSSFLLYLLECGKKLRFLFKSSDSYFVNVSFVKFITFPEVSSFIDSIGSLVALLIDCSGYLRDSFDQTSGYFVLVLLHTKRGILHVFWMGLVLINSWNLVLNFFPLIETSWRFPLLRTKSV